jgi:hypothetical protein
VIACMWAKLNGHIGEFRGDKLALLAIINPSKRRGSLTNHLAAVCAESAGALYPVVRFMEVRRRLSSSPGLAI